MAPETCAVAIPATLSAAAPTNSRRTVVIVVFLVSLLLIVASGSPETPLSVAWFFLLAWRGRCQNSRDRCIPRKWNRRVREGSAADESFRRARDDLRAPMHAELRVSVT